MKTSNKLLIHGLGALALLTAASLVRLGVFVFYQQPDYVHFSKHDDTLITKTLPHQRFHGMELEGFLNVKIIRGDSHVVKIKTTREIHERMTVAVTNGTLKIRQNYFSLHLADQTEISISMPSMQALRTRGGAEINLSGFAEQRTAIHTRGLVDITGRDCRVNSLRLVGSGMIGVDLSACEVKNADLDLGGIGEVKLRMTGGILRGKVGREISLDHKGPVSRKDIAVKTNGPFEKFQKVEGKQPVR